MYIVNAITKFIKFPQRAINRAKGTFKLMLIM